MRPQIEEGLSVGFQVGETVEVEVGDVAQGGWCVARPAGFPVVFVRHALPGERVIARVTEVTSRFARADAVRILRPSADRVQPPCPNARPGGCGGCDWQHASLPAQRALKATVIGQHLRRLAGIDREVIVEPLPGDEAVPEPPATTSATTTNPLITARGGPQATNPTTDPLITARGGPPTATTNPLITARGEPPGLGWRTRVQFAVRADGVAGLRAHRSHEVVDIGDCPIAHPEIRDLGIPRRRWPGALAVEAVVGSGEPAERAVIVTLGGRGGIRDAGRGGDGTARSAQEGQDWARAVPAEAVLSRAGHRLTPLRGRAHVLQRAAGREWRVSAGAFWQVHPAAADALTAAVVAALEPKPGDRVLDLYCGAGLFAGAVAPLVGPDGAVVGVEYDSAAIRDARHNLREWPWARVHRGDVAQVLRRGGLPPARLAVADPPRAGLAREVVGYLSGASGTERFAYVSCDPATLARDLGLLLGRGWTLEGLRAFDAFPMTHHVECVAVVAR
jgi:tRNA/tmRNA/rRNA uracil-C5-methylase (TrmA/RlmC/RlmD family)